MKTKMVLSALLGMTLLSSCGDNAPEPLVVGDPQNVPITKSEVMLEIESQGGHCAEGECTSLTTMYTDGTWEREGQETVSGIFLGERLKSLQETIDSTNFNDVKDKPFKDECPTAFDGQELTYTFHLENEDIVLSSCTYDLSEVDVIEEIDQLFAAPSMETPR